MDRHPSNEALLALVVALEESMAAIAVRVAALEKPAQPIGKK